MAVTHEDILSAWGRVLKPLSSFQSLTVPLPESHLLQRRRSIPRGNQPINLNHYATKKSVAESMLDVALFMSNATRLKSVLEHGPSSHYYTTLITLISISLLLQVVIGILLVVIGKESSPAAGFLLRRPLVVGQALASPVKLPSHLLTKPELYTN